MIVLRKIIQHLKPLSDEESMDIYFQYWQKYVRKNTKKGIQGEKDRIQGENAGSKPTLLRRLTVKDEPAESLRFAKRRHFDKGLDQFYGAPPSWR